MAYRFLEPQELQPSGFQNLANAIIIQAVRDYNRVLKYKDRNEELDYPHKVLEEDLTKFFHGKWFAILTNIDGVWLMQTVEEQHRKPGMIRNPKTHFEKHPANDF